MSPLFRTRRSAQFARNSLARRLNKSPRTRLMLQALEERSVPALLTVTATGDTGGAGQLRAIFETARTNGEDDTITFDVGVTAVTLTSALNTYDENFALTIQGNGKAVTTITAAASTRIFDFNVAAAQQNITITDIQLKGGNSSANGGAIRTDNENLTLTNVAFTSNTAVGGGAVAITSATTTLTVTGCDFTSNTATSTVTANYVGGGGIFAGAAATVTINTSTFDANRAGTGGSSFFSAATALQLNSDSSTFKNGKSTGTAARSSGAFFIGSGSSTITIDHSTVTGNSTGFKGGMLYNYNTGVSLTIQNTIVSGNTSTHRGGAIYVYGAASKLTLVSDTFSNNTASGASGRGGAIFSRGALSVTSSTFSGNTAVSFAGAIYQSATSTVTLSTFSSNTGSGGGAVVLTGGTMTLNNSQFTGNTATGTTGGGAIYSIATLNSTLNTFSGNRATSATGPGGAIRVGGTSTISFSDFSANTAGGLGGAVHVTGTSTVSNSTLRNNTAGSNGGAINAAGTLTVNQSTFSKNTAAGTGGGGAIASSLAASTITINNSTLADNTATGTGANGGGFFRSAASTLSVTSTIIAGNKRTGTGTLGIDWSTTSAVTIAGNNSLIGTNDNSSITLTGSVQSGVDTAPVDPLLNALADNGGFVLPDGNKIKTMSLNSGSPAIDQGVNPSSFTFDQRDAGFPREVGGDADVGAYEGISKKPSATAIANNVTVSGGTTFDVTVTFTDDLGLLISTIDVNDIVVKTSFGGTTLNATGIVVSPPSGVATPVTATYTFNAPDNSIIGTWDPSDTDQYSVWLVGTVTDNDGPNNSAKVPTKLTSFTATLGAKAMVVDNNSGDTDDGDYGAGQLTLREAINFANLNTGSQDTITFAGAFNSASTITLKSGYNVTDSLVITGKGADSLTINANKTGRHFNVDDGTATILDVQISGMKLTSGSAAGGGAFRLNGENLTLNGVWIASNTSSGNGGAIDFPDIGTVLINNSLISGNSAAGNGGALTFLAGSTITLSNSTVSGNTAGGFGGFTGGSATYSGSIILKNSTITNNTSGSQGAIRLSPGGAADTVLTMESSILAGNVPSSIPDFAGKGLTSTKSIVGWTAGIVTDNGGSLWGTSSITIVNALLDPLANYGGPMPTHRLQFTSPAVDAGSNPDTLSFDQRGTGFPREVNLVTDMGAYESAIPPIPTAKVVNAPNIIVGGASPYSFDVKYTDDSGFDTTTFGTADVTVFGNGFGIGGVSPTGFSTSGGGNYYTVTYTIPAPAGGWGGVNIGAYTVQINASQVSDDSSNFVAFKTNIGTFNTAIATTLTVDLESDVNDGNYTANNLTLREALSLVNGNIGLDTINFNAGKFTGTPIVMASTLTISDEVQINGPGLAKLVLDGNNAVQPFNIAVTGAGKSVSMSDMTINKGKAATGGGIEMTDDSLTLTNVVVSNGSATSNGGAIALTTGTLTLTNSTLNNNSASVSGGGIYASSTAIISTTNSVIRNNVSASSGSGMYVGGNSTVNVDSTLIKDNNSTGSWGSAIFLNSTANVTISRSMISGNTAASFGAVYFYTGGLLKVTDSTFKNNVSGDSGAAIALFTAAATIQNSTFTGNVATAGSGGAIAVLSGSATTSLDIRNTTIAQNSATAGTGGISITSTSTTFNLSSTIVAGNTGTNRDITTPAAFSVTGTDNLVGFKEATWNFSGSPNQFSTGAPLNPGLNPIANNSGFVLLDGSFVQTMSLVTGSLALDTGNNNDTLSFDERGTGHPRTIGSGTDVGAFENAANPIPTASAVASNVTISGGTTFDVTVTFKDDVGIDISSIDVNDIVVKTAFGGTTLNAVSFVASPPSGTATPVTATYTFNAPNNVVAGTWDASDTDLYAVWIVGSVTDADPNAIVQPTKLTTFSALLGTKSMTVDNAGDTDDGDYSVGNLTLREAVSFSNLNNPNTDTIGFNLPSGTTITLTSGLLLTDSADINGPGANKLAINANSTGRIFTTATAHVFNISGLEITGGSATQGGAIKIGPGDSVTLDGVWIHGNTASGIGGAISIDTSVSPSTVDLQVKNSTISGNSAGGSGGAVYFLRGATMLFSNSTLSGNKSGNLGGAVGGSTTSSGTVTVHNSTVTGNTAVNAGGAFRFTVAGYSAGILNLVSSIVAGNSATTDPDIQDFNVNADFSIIGIVSAGTGTITGANNNTGTPTVPVDPLLSGLGNFGGPTPTHVLLSGSPALNTGSDPDTLTFDQRGATFPRLVGPQVDMGATEGITPIPSAKLTSAPNVVVGGATTYSFTVVYSDSNGIDTTTIGNNDVTVSGKGYGSPVNPTSFNIDASIGTSVTVTYTITAPTPPVGWDLTDNGNYTITMVGTPTGVSDSDTPTVNFVPAGSLGNFQVAVPAILIVDELSDVDDSDYSVGKQSLREAIKRANTEFVGSSDIVSITVNGTVTMTGAAYSIGDVGLTITGPGSSLFTVDANNAHRILSITTTSDVNISGLTLTKGSETAGIGGAIVSSSGKLTLSSVNVVNNIAEVGGAIRVLANGTLVLNDTSISGNTAATIGSGPFYGGLAGGVYMGGNSNLIMDRSTVSNNRAGVNGGGLYFANGGSLNMTNSTVSGNIANVTLSNVGGGGIYFYGAVNANGFKVSNSTISGNQATGNGAGLRLVNFVGNARFANSTITNNKINGGAGGGLAVNGATGTVELQSTIVAGNIANAIPDMAFGAASNVAGDNNIVGVADVGLFTLTGTGNQTGTFASPLDAKLDPLGNYGGPTQTHRLQSTSPAVDNGNNVDSVSFDQRGTPNSRVVGKSADVGAYEIQAPATVASVVISDGTGLATTHRSQFRQIIVTFSTPVTFTGSVASAFTVHRKGNSLLNGNPIGDVSLLASPASGTVSTVTITFNNADTTFVEGGGTIAQPLGSLIDGIYDFKIDSSKVSTVDGALDGDGVGGFGGDHVIIGTAGPTGVNPNNGWFRFFGDSDGDGRVNQTDYNAFRLAFLGGPNNIFDFDGGAVGQVSQPDYNAFRLRFLGAP